MIWHDLLTYMLTCVGTQDVSRANCIQMQIQSCLKPSCSTSGSFWHQHCQMHLREDEEHTVSINRFGGRISQTMVDTLPCTRPSSASRASGFNAVLFPWLLWPHRFLQGAFCHGNAYQSIVLCAGWLRGKTTLEQKSVCIYLFVLQDRWMTWCRWHF